MECAQITFSRQSVLHDMSMLRSPRSKEYQALMFADIKGACMHCADRFTSLLTQYSRTPVS